MGDKDLADERRSQAQPADTGTRQSIDDYLLAVEPPKRVQLERIRALAKQMVPDAEEAIVYAMPTLKYQGKPFLGFNAHKNHIGIYPYSSRVIQTLKDQLQGYGQSSGAIRVPLDAPIPERVLQQVINVRLKEIREKMKGK
jgi:uncharacterized protein YdhG (YjbR/CyaY superfamily)